MIKHILWVLVLCSGCSFDLTALRRLDSGADSQVIGDSEVSDVWMADEDSAVINDAGIDAYAEDTGSDAGTDAFMNMDDGGSDAGADAHALTCTDVPDIAGSYRVNHRLMGCTAQDFGYIPLTRLDSCSYQFDDGSSSPPIFNGNCTVVIEGPTYRYECSITYNVWHYLCTLTPVSGGLTVDCRFVSGAAPPTTDPCSFFSPEM